MSENRKRKEHLMIRLLPGEKEYFRKAAEQHGEVHLSTWVYKLMVRTSKRTKSKVKLK